MNRLLPAFLVSFCLAALPALGAEAPVAGTDWLAVFREPDIFFLLLCGAVYGLLLELAHPGLIFPGLVGLACAGLAFTALDGMTVDYTGLALFMLGMALAGGEVLVPAHGALALGGTVMLAVGGYMMKQAGFGVSYAAIGLVAAFNLAFAWFIAYFVVSARNKKVVTGREALIGAGAEVVSWGGEKGEVRVAGEIWRAEGGEFRPGDKVTVSRIDGLTLFVARA